MAVPKKRKSHARARTQRAHQALTLMRWVTCAQCGSPMVLHQVCRVCGYYRSRKVIQKDANA